MRLYLVQHGESLPKDADPERGLSATGFATVEGIAALARQQGLAVDRVVHSGKKRALQTAEIMAAAIQPAVPMQAEKGLGPMDDVQGFVAGLGAQGSLMVVGHLPFMAKLASYLVTGSPDTPVCQFQNGGIVCLDREDDTGKWSICWMLMPRMD